MRLFLSLFMIGAFYLICTVEGMALSRNIIPEEIKPLIESQQYEDRKMAYLTFDDGPSTNTTAILDILDQYKIKATFFVMGNEERYAENGYKEIIKRGHTIALHSYTHDYRVIYQSLDGYFKDVAQLEKMLNEYGVKSKLIRFPGGSRNIELNHKKVLRSSIISELNKNGYTYVDWNIDSTDGISPTISQQTIIGKVLNGTKNKKQAVILLHDINSMKNTVKALPVIIEGLKKQGYEFAAIDEQTPFMQFK